MTKYGLVGKSLNHSFSKTFFDDFFLKNSVSASFYNLEIDEISKIKTVFNDNFSGLTVTNPYKESIIPFLDFLSDEAEQIGAVNVIKISENQKYGFNSDAHGFHQSIKPFLTNVHERALILGNGGAAKAVSFVFKKLGIDVIYAVRNPQWSNEFSFESINQHMISACKVIVQCTPVGMFPNIDDFLCIPFDFISSDHLVIDLIYNPSKTVFLRNAEKTGAIILNGESMLKEQAMRAWEIWNNRSL